MTEPASSDRTYLLAPEYLNTTKRLSRVVPPNSASLAGTHFASQLDTNKLKIGTASLDNIKHILIR
jgi:hypothetical protein